jgi:transposase
MEITEKEYNKLLQVITELKEENRLLRERVERLENELRKYRNENTPSSMTPPFLKDLEKKVDKEIKNAEKKEDEHPSKYNARNSRPEPGKIELHKINECPNCGNPLRKRNRTFKRIVIDIKNIETETTEHLSETGYCTNCEEIFRADVPNTLPNMKYGINVISLVSVMSIGLNSTTSAIASFLNDIVGIKMSEATVCNIQRSLRDHLQEDYDVLERDIKEAFVRYKDETSHRHNGKNFWAWVIATSQGIIYKIEKRRSHKFAKQMEIKKGVDVTDGYAGYNKLECEHQRCWAHLLRKAKHPPYQFGENESYRLYKKHVGQLLRLFHSAKTAKEAHGASEKLQERYEKRFHSLLDAISDKPMGRNIVGLTNYIMRFDGEWFTFLKYKDVDPTNNFAERALRPVVIKRKISQQSRGIENMESYAMQASMFMSLKQQDRSYSQYLTNLLSDFPRGNKY